MSKRDIGGCVDPTAGNGHTATHGSAPETSTAHADRSAPEILTEHYFDEYIRRAVATVPAQEPVCREIRRRLRVHDRALRRKLEDERRVSESLAQHLDESGTRRVKAEAERDEYRDTVRAACEELDREIKNRYRLLAAAREVTDLVNYAGPHDSSVHPKMAALKTLVDELTE